MATTVPAHVAAVLLPCSGMAAVTGAVWVKLYVDRVGELQARQISPQRLATATQAAATLTHVQASDNFRNLHELPVLFYAVCLAHAASGLAPAPSFVRAAWAFVGLRALHSLVHVTYNRVMHRFTAYLASTAALAYLWVHLTRRLRQ
jgi:hypothetical protein